MNIQCGFCGETGHHWDRHPEAVRENEMYLQSQNNDEASWLPF